MNDLLLLDKGKYHPMLNCVGSDRKLGILKKGSPVRRGDPMTSRGISIFSGGRLFSHTDWTDCRARTGARQGRSISQCQTLFSFA